MERIRVEGKTDKDKRTERRETDGTERKGMELERMGKREIRKERNNLLRVKERRGIEIKGRRK